MRLDGLAALICATIAFGPHRGEAEQLPASIVAQIPAGYAALEWKTLREGRAPRPDWLVAVHKPDEQAIYDKTQKSPPRRLLIFRPQGRLYVLAGRNDLVIFGIGDGGQCDPFEDGAEGLAVRGEYFTVQNEVACGAHWTDFFTFRFDAARNAFIFHNERAQSMKMNSSDDPNAEALIPNGSSLRRADPRHPVTFDNFHPKN